MTRFGVLVSTLAALALGRDLAAQQQRQARDGFAFGAAAYWYPSNRRPLYLKLGIGLVTHRADDGTDVITSSAIGPQFGVGYEWPVSPHVLVSPFINVALGI